jgi:hypothetical protein
MAKMTELERIQRQVKARNEGYQASPVAKRPRRSRRSPEQMHELRQAIKDVCEREHPLSVRGVFYRIEMQGLVAKTDGGYDTVQAQTVKLRRSGEIPYHHIIDGTRWATRPRGVYDDAEAALADMAASYRRNLWQQQDVYVEFWSEKDAISSMITDITLQWQAPLCIARGYSSLTFLHDTGEELARVGKPVYIYNLGDHDAHGLQAWEKAKAGLREHAPGAELHFERLAVTPEQIEEHGLPTRIPKKSDRDFRGPAVEVDAMPTETLRELVTDAILRHVDPDALALEQRIEAEELEGLRWLSLNGLAS